VEEGGPEVAVEKTPGRQPAKPARPARVPTVANDAVDATTALATAPAPIIIPDPTSDDDLLSEFGMEAHPRGGFHGLLEVIPTRADYILDLIRANSLWPLLSGLSCCAIEMMSTATPMNDMDRFGMFGCSPCAPRPAKRTS
jgi:hypothetical protein